MYMSLSPAVAASALTHVRRVHHTYTAAQLTDAGGQHYKSIVITADTLEGTYSSFIYFNTTLAWGLPNHADWSHVKSVGESVKPYCHDLSVGLVSCDT